MKADLLEVTAHLGSSRLLQSSDEERETKTRKGLQNHSDRDYLTAKYGHMRPIELLNLDGQTGISNIENPNCCVSLFQVSPQRLYITETQSSTRNRDV